MNIGIDLDNTIVQYDSLFYKVAHKENFIDHNWTGDGKTDLRNHLRRQVNGEQSWMKLQGLVYGKYMYDAEMMPGVANFILSCKMRNHRIYIVSHKTEYGHYDPEKISLRQEALRWMTAKRFFGPEYCGINKEDVFFVDTREEKVKKIGLLKCDWFIDDLPEVFEEPSFPVETKQILFGSYESEIYHNTTVINSWRKISEKILGRTTDGDVISWSKQMVGEPIKHIEKIPGRGNSRVYKIMTLNGNSYALKYYPDQLIDTRPRLETEFQTLQILHQNNIYNVPKTIEKNDDMNLGLYEWINGENIGEPSVDDLEQAIGFTEQLYSLSQKIDGPQIDIASEACLSGADLIQQIEKRLKKLNTVKKGYSDLAHFLAQTFEPLWKEVRDESYSLWPIDSQNVDLTRKKQTLSPSDFGYHNALRGADGKLVFIDFDYFGWDDPVKLTADFVWHPAMKLNSEMTAKWIDAMLGIFFEDTSFKNRLNVALPLYGMRWALIVLNEFLPGFADRRKEAGETETYDIDKTRKIQLNKAQHYCAKVKAMVLQTALA